MIPVQAYSAPEVSRIIGELYPAPEVSRIGEFVMITVPTPRPRPETVYFIRQDAILSILIAPLSIQIRGGENGEETFETVARVVITTAEIQPQRQPQPQPQPRRGDSARTDPPVISNAQYTVRFSSHEEAVAFAKNLAEKNYQPAETVWEYRTIEQRRGYQLSTLEEQVNQLGNEGWIIESSHVVAGEPTRIVIIMKRPK